MAVPGTEDVVTATWGFICVRKRPRSHGARPLFPALTGAQPRPGQRSPDNTAEPCISQAQALQERGLHPGETEAQALGCGP